MPMSGALPGLAGDLVRCEPDSLLPKTDKYIQRIENKMRKDGWKTIRKHLQEDVIMSYRNELFFIPEELFCDLLSDANYGEYNCPTKYLRFMHVDKLPGIDNFYKWIAQGDAQAIRCDPSIKKSFFVITYETWEKLFDEIT